jgi:HK97 gp10 family phage protein
MSDSVKIEGWKELYAALDAKKVAAEKLADVVKECGEEMVETAKQNCPTKTGTLKSSITATYTDGGTTVEVEATAKNSKGAKYAHFVEFGTKKHGPEQPFLRPAQKAGRAKLKEELRKIVEAK